MKLLLPTLLGLLAIGSANATNVKLSLQSYQQSPVSVQYQLFNQAGKPITEPKSATLPQTVSLPDEADSIQVVSITNKAIPKPEHTFYFPKPYCQWHKDSGEPAMITFEIKSHQISCK